MNEEITSKTIKVVRELLNIPHHKIIYIINNNLLDGLFLNLPHYGIELTIRTFELFCDVLNTTLTGSFDIEYEFTQKEYNNIMKLKKYCTIGINNESKTN